MSIVNNYDTICSRGLTRDIICQRVTYYMQREAIKAKALCWTEGPSVKNQSNIPGIVYQTFGNQTQPNPIELRICSKTLRVPEEASASSIVFTGIWVKGFKGRSLKTGCFCFWEINIFRWPFSNWLSWNLRSCCQLSKFCVLRREPFHPVHFVEVMHWNMRWIFCNYQN